MRPARARSSAPSWKRAPRCSRQSTTSTSRNTIYEAFWDLIIDGADNLAYRLALNTLVTQHAVRLDGARVATELQDPEAIRALAAAIAAASRRGARTSP